MPHLFTCPHCQSKTRVDDRYSGQSGECFTCGAQIQLPDFAGATESNDEILQTNRRPLGVLMAAGVVITLLVCLLFAIVRFGGSSVSRLAQLRVQNRSIENLEAIAGALNAYAADFGAYPPAVLRDPNGKPMHSWRVLILPYLGEQERYDLFDLSKPWDAEVNLQASYGIPDVFVHPASINRMQDQACYMLVTGPQTLFPPGQPGSPRSVADSPAQTILVISAVPPSGGATIGGWAEPIDLDFAVMNGVIGGTVGVEPGGWLDDGVTMATVDGRGHFLPSDTPPETFRALVTPAGGEFLPDDTLD